MGNRALAIGAVGAIGLAVAFGASPAGGDWLFARALDRQLAPRAHALWDDDGLNLFFCGTGSPLPSLKRAQTCTAVFAGGRFFLVDAGTGSWERIQSAGIPGDRLAGIFLTHLHSDHIGDIGEADLGSWVGGRAAPLAVYGPSGVEGIVDGLNAEYALDHRYRTAHHGSVVADPATAGLRAHAFAGEAAEVVYEQHGLKVTAFPVAHAPVAPAVGFRFDYAGRSVVISGDTAFSETVAEAALGADLLVHEAQANHMVAKMAVAASAAGNLRLAKILNDIPTYHTSPAEAARAAAGADWLVLTHLTPAPDNLIAKRLFLRGVRRSKLKIAEDGMAVLLPAGGGVNFAQF
jgi:ribonuclease Z